LKFEIRPGKSFREGDKISRFYYTRAFINVLICFFLVGTGLILELGRV